MIYQNENFSGELDFRSRFHIGFHVSEHIHEYSEFLYCRSGECEITVNGRNIRIAEKQIVWIPPNYIHKYDFDGAEVVCAVFSNDLIPLFFKAQAGRYMNPSTINAEEFSYFLDSFYELDKEDYCRISGYLNLVCAKVIQESSFDTIYQTDGELYQKIISYISKNYTSDLSLSGIARMFGYNKKYLSHTLHSLTGVNFRYLLNFYRIRHAQQMLVNDQEPSIAEIAMSSGFSSLTTFHRCFYVVSGMTPLEYRSRYRVRC